MLAEAQWVGAAEAAAKTGTRARKKASVPAGAQAPWASVAAIDEDEGQHGHDGLDGR